MSRILARSVTADLCGRFFNLLLFILLLPFILVIAALMPQGPESGRARALPAMAARRAQGDLKPGP
ncbi:hypothetical protein C0V75_06085 [Tabrizicola sp. TH137]|uniref:hypothetical protein n=1 Tax=Tabrizicola sp. TH137 TaxID=2067452 RepID=UPI000C7E708E|nr:hypothetical protein [Tabrizicola sp. TH137]PLL12995.1 hypothetical protein C0V75_06085 [Tabrizicola sp. TH137]